MSNGADDGAHSEWAQEPSKPAGSTPLGVEISPASDSAPDVWATIPRQSTPAGPIASSNQVTTSSSSSMTSGISQSSTSAAEAVLSAVANQALLSDLDPFAPSPPGTPQPSRTLGQTVKSKNALLELLPNDDDDDEENNRGSVDSAWRGEQHDRTGHDEHTSRTHDSSSSSSTTKKPELGASAAATSGPSASHGSGFLGGMFRSISGAGAETSSQNADSTGGKRTSTPPMPNAQAGPSNTPKPSRPVIDTHSPQQSRSAALTRPLVSIANVFKSATTAGSAPGTPERTASPAPPQMTGTEKNSVSRETQFDEKTGHAVSSQAPPSSPRRAGKQRERERDMVRERDRNRGQDEKKEEDKEVTFDFNKFLEQMRSRSADPVAKYLRSFLKEFSRRPPIAVADQIRVINDFLDFIAGKMRQVDPWRALFVQNGQDWDPERAESEFDMAMEAMEKLVMNRLWHLTFTPALDLSALPGQVSPTGDVERDQILTQRIKLFAWIKPSHLDLPISDPPNEEPAATASKDAPAPSSPRIEQLISESEAPGQAIDQDKHDKTMKSERAMTSQHQQRQVQGFLDFARRELLKINSYKAPRDKMICVLNCCKVIFGLIRHVSSEEGADAFIPFLIFVVLKANPEHLVSNLQYIQRFRNPEKLSGEGGYYLSSLNGAISFIETVDAASLSNITQVEFHENVAKAIRELPTEPNESPRLSSRPSFPAEAPPRARDPPSTPGPAQDSPGPPTPSRSPGPGAEVTAAAYTDSDSPELLRLRNSSPPPAATSFPESTRQFLLRSTDSVERIVSKPLGAIGRIFDQLEQTVSELPGGQQAMYGHNVSPSSPRRRNLPSLPPAGPEGQVVPPSPSSKRRALWPIVGAGGAGSQIPPPPPGTGMYVAQSVTDGEAAREIDRQHEQQRQASLETLRSVFPAMEDDVLEMVLLSNSGDMARTIDSLLEMA